MSIFKRLFGKDQSRQQLEVPDQHEKTKSNPEASIPVDLQEEAIISQSPKPRIEEKVSEVKYSELPNSHKRTIRVFISSTFRDMMEERDAMMTHTWPELRRFCRERQVEFVEVDLRWGIAEEQSTRKETLKLCLDEIRACRPFFIGLLGERYGWVPDDDAFTSDLKEEQPWLKSIKGKSVTELEILHGVLNNPEMAGRAFFYFRDPKYVEIVPKEKKADFLSETLADAEKQTELKDLIRKTCTEKSIPLKENYSDPQSLAALVLEQLKAAIGIQFPVEEIPDPLTREARDHEAFAESRRRTYIGRPDYFDALNKHCNQNGKPLILLGDSGSGKSALLANWVEHWRKIHPNDFIFQHYIGGTPDGSVHWKLMSRMMAEIKQWSDDTDEIPRTNDDILRDFPLWLSKARIIAEHKGVHSIVVIDALNQLEDKDRGRLLGWLPAYPFTGALRLIVSTLPGDTLEILGKRDWPTHQIQPFTKDERRRMIIDYLARFGKKFDVQRLVRLSAEPAAANPLYLKILLDEMRVTGTHEKLDERLNDYLAAKDIPALLSKVLGRYERDYEHDRKGLIGEALGLIWAARRGLTEAELLQLLRPAHLPQLPLAIWAPLRSALEEGLLDRGGILNFAHDFLRTAVEAAFLPDLDKKDDFRIQLAGYFEDKVPDSRICDELPWLLYQTKSFQRLRNCLLNPDHFVEICIRNELELVNYWVVLGEIKSMGQQYLSSFNEWGKKNSDERISFVANELGNFLYNSSLFAEAEPIVKKTLQLNENIFGEEHLKVAIALNDYSMLLARTNRPSESQPLLKRAISIKEKIYGKHHPEVAISINNLATIYYDIGQLSEAELLFKRALQIDEDSYGKDNDKVADRLNNLAILLHNSNRKKEAQQLIKRALRIYEDSFGKEHPSVANCLGNQAALLMENHKFIEAEAVIRRSINIYEKLFGKNHPNMATSLGILAEILNSTKHLSEAESIYRIVLQIDENNFGVNHPNVAIDLNNLGSLLVETTRNEEAEIMMKRAIQINKSSYGDNHISVANILMNLSSLYYKTGRLEEAKPILVIAREILEQYKKNEGFEHPIYTNLIAIQLQCRIREITKKNLIYVILFLILGIFGFILWRML